VDIMHDFGLSIRRSCRIIGLSRMSFAYAPKNNQLNEIIRQRLKEMAQRRRRFGCARLHVLLKREGFRINHKRTERIYRQEGLSLRIRRRRKMASLLRVELPKPERPNHIWSMDFMKDALCDGRTFKVLPILDEYTRKCFRLEVDTSINGVRVCRALSEIGQQEGLPEIIIIDNGPEFIGKALDAWAYQRGDKAVFYYTRQAGRKRLY